MPTVFVSSVNADLKERRQSVADQLIKAEFFIKEEFKTFKPDGDPILVYLDRLIQESDAVIHLVGDETGSKPPVSGVDAVLQNKPGFFELLPNLKDLKYELSYTQWEAWLAVYYQKISQFKELVIYDLRQLTKTKEHSGNGSLSQDQHLNHLKDENYFVKSLVAEFDLTTSIYEWIINVKPKLATLDYALGKHAQFLRYKYESAPLLNVEPFALKHVYVDTHCSFHRWEQIKPGKNDSLAGVEHKKIVDCYAENLVENPRHDLIEKTFEILKDSSIHEPILIQGVAGSGKSSFTLKFANELLARGFKPLHINLKRIDVTAQLKDTLLQKLEYNDKYFHHNQLTPQLEDKHYVDLKNSRVKHTQSEFHHLSPYLIILDGWDEISVGASSGFKDDLKEFLNHVRTEFYDRLLDGNPRIAVILTGRPTVDVTSTTSKLLSKQTPILTVRPLNPLQLIDVSLKIKSSIKYKPLMNFVNAVLFQDCQFTEYHDLAHQRVNMPDDAWHQWNSWIHPLYEQYATQFNKVSEQGKDQSDKLGVLGSPLLSILAFKLILDIEGKDEIRHVINNPTTLYRKLIDLTCLKGAKAESSLDQHDPLNKNEEHYHRLIGGNLRLLLWETAAAMTAREQEAISRNELKCRISKETQDLVNPEKLSNLQGDHLLSRLIISFFFKESPQLGCEFLHKSFREYLYAEGIVQQLKEYASHPKVIKAFTDDPNQGLRERSDYWKDFDKDDPRFAAIHKLAKTCCSSWISVEIEQYLTEILRWEILERDHAKHLDAETNALHLNGWIILREFLADAWDWWAEGYHLRNRITRDPETNSHQLERSMVDELIKYCLPLDPEEWKEKDHPPVRTTTIDARLGEILLLLTVVVHHLIDEKLREQPTLNDPTTKYPRRYQSFNDGWAQNKRFIPGGDLSYGFKTYLQRINASGNRLRGEYGPNIILTRTNLRGANLSRANLSRANLSGADLSGANLSGANLSEAYLIEAYLSVANLSRADLSRADLSRADLSRADLSRADLIEAYFGEADLRGADLRGAKLEAIQLLNVRFLEVTKLDPEIKQALRKLKT